MQERRTYIVVAYSVEQQSLALTLLLRLHYVRLVNVDQVLVLQTLRGVLTQLLLQLKRSCLKEIILLINIK